MITDGLHSYSLFTYNCNQLQWSGYWRHATIGYNSGGKFYDNDPLTGLSQAKEIGCRNRPESDYNNIIYTLSVSGNLLQQLRKRCYDIYHEDITYHGDQNVISDISRSLQPCPCSWLQARRDRRFSFQWQAWVDDESLCYQQRFPSSNKAAQLCCYSRRTRSVN